MHNLRSWYTSKIVERPRLQPPMGNLQLSFDLLPEEMHLIDGHREFKTHIFVVFLSEYPVLILTDIIPIERVF